MRKILFLILLFPSFIALKGQTITVTSQQGGEVLVGGQTYTITWTSTGSIDAIDLYFSNGTKLETGIPNTGSYDWTLPSDSRNRSNIKLQLKSAANPSVYGLSGTIQIEEAPHSITVISPNSSGDVLQAGSPNTIEWSSTGYLFKVTIQYSLDDGTTYRNLTPYGGTPDDGSFDWTPANHLNSTELKIKILKVNNADVFDESDESSTLTIGRTIDVTAPEAGNLIVGEVKNIEWTSTGGITHVDLAYSKDYGSWTSIADNEVNSGSYSWTVPNEASNLIRLRVIDHDDPSAYKILSGFTISSEAQVLTLSAPNGGETFTEGSNINIDWGYSTNLAGTTLEFYYSLDNGATWKFLNDNISIEEGSLEWRLPTNVSSDECLVRAHLTGLSAIDDVSDAVFSITLGDPSLTIFSPNGGERYTAGSGGTVSFQSTGGVENVDIHYSIDGGASWVLFESQLPTENGYAGVTWPDVSSSDMLLRIQSSINSAVNDDSDATFSVLKLKLIEPYPNTTLYQGGAARVRWSKTATTSEVVSLFYSTDGGTSWQLIADDIENSGLYSWTVPKVVSATSQMRIEDSNDPAIFDVSQGDFSIEASPIVLSSPLGGEYWDKEADYEITWSETLAINWIKISYSSDGGVNWREVVSNYANSHAYTWNTPNLMSGNVQVRVENQLNPGMAAISEVFSIGIDEPGTITVISPNGGESFPGESNQEITWSSTGGVGDVNLDYSSNGGSDWVSIVTNETNDGAYNWTLPDLNSSDFLVRVIQSDNESVFDASDATFKVGKTITLTSPNGGESWDQKSLQIISWEVSTGASESVNLLFSLDNGTSWETIVANFGTATEYQWQLPVAASTMALVRVELTDAAQVNDVSDGNFSILDLSHSIDLTSPSYPLGFWTEGETKEIKWKTEGLVEKVNLYHSNDGGVNYVLFASDLDNDPNKSTTYSWIVPNGINSYNARIKVEEAGNASVFDSEKIRISDLRTVTITSPNGGESFNGLDTIPITWTETGLVHSIQFAYSLDDGQSWKNFHVVQLYDDRGTIDWVVPNQPTSDALIRASGFQSNGSVETSDGTFSIIKTPSSITITKPNDGTWGIYGSLGVDFESVGVQYADLLYSVDAGNTWVKALSRKAVNYEYFNWSGPGFNTTTALIKVQDSDHNDVFDTSDELLTIIGYSELEIVSANGGEQYRSDSTYTINWNYTEGSIHPIVRVDLEYSLDGGLNWRFIADDLDVNTVSSFEWKVPSNVNTAQALLRIVDSADERNFDISDAEFTIQTTKGISLTSPVNTDLWLSEADHVINWDFTGLIENVALFYSIDNGVNWIDIESQIVNTGSYLWRTPAAIHSQIRVKIEEQGNSEVADISDPFVMTLKTASLEILTPNGGEELREGDSYSITWDWTGEFDDQWVLEYSLDNGQSWSFITDGAAFDDLRESHLWQIPGIPESSADCLIRIQSDGISDISDATFKIEANSIEITSPNGGEDLVGNTTEIITWSTTGMVDPLELHYSLDNGSTWNLIGSNLDPTVGSAQWIVPNVNSTDALIKVVSGVKEDQSDAVFSLSEDNTITIGRPVGGEIYAGNSSQVVTWETTGIVGDLELYYSLDNGVEWSLVEGGIDVAAEIVYWTVPNIATTQGLVKLVSGAIEDQSDPFFNIVETNTITIISPNGGESYVGNSEEMVTWETTGTVGDLELYYSEDNGANWNLAGNDIVSSSGSTSWTTPNVNTTQALVRLVSGAVEDQSDAVFTINEANTITITSPNGGESYLGNSEEMVSWETTGTVGDLELYYSEDNGVNWNLASSDIAASSGSTSWTIPNVTTTQALVKLVSGSVEDQSNAVFTINEANTITITSPNGAESYVGNSVEMVSWETTGTVGDLELYYSEDNGANWNLAGNGIASSSGSTSWTIPNVNTTQALVKLVSGSLDDQSDAVFSINEANTITIISPNGGESYMGELEETVSWTMTGTLGQLELYYSLDNGSTWELSKNDIDPTTGSTPWMVPNTESSEALVRLISDSVEDQSDAVFTIERTLITAIEEDLIKDDMISIFPNPVLNYLNIDLSRMGTREVDIQLINPAGNSIFSLSGYGEKKLIIDVSGYDNGLYVIRFSDGRSTAIKKVIIRK